MAPGVKFKILYRKEAVEQKNRDQLQSYWDKSKNIHIYINIYIYIYISFFFLPQLAIMSQSRRPIPFSLIVQTTPLASTCHTVVTYWNNRFTWSRYCGREQIESGLARSVTGSLGCTSWVHNVLITVMTNNVVDIVQTTINQSPFFNWIQLLFL